MSTAPQHCDEDGLVAAVAQESFLIWHHSSHRSAGVQHADKIELNNERGNVGIKQTGLWYELHCAAGMVATAAGRCGTHSLS